MAQIISKDSVPYRIWDKVNGVWNQLNFRTNAKSVLADDGKTMQNKCGAIDGITSDLSGESETIAASIKCVNQINSSLTKVRTYLNEEDGKLHFVDAMGADSVLPFSSMIGDKYKVAWTARYGGTPCIPIKGINKIKITSSASPIENKLTIYGSNTYNSSEIPVKVYSTSNGSHNDIIDVSAYDYLLGANGDDGYFEFVIVE